jgi:NADP-dependent 3-hydroxy acid dehydrogenase YdfG
VSDGGLAGRVALVTGASGDLGRAIAVNLGGCGARLCVVGRDFARLTSAKDELRDAGAEVLAVTADLTDPQRTAELSRRVESELGGLDILVHCSGGYTRGDLAESTVDDLDAMYRANVRAPYQLTKAVLPMLVAGRGDVVFVNSTQGTAARGGVGQFAATQHAMRAVADSLRAEVNPSGVRVTTLHLGRTATSRQQRIFATEGRPYPREELIQPRDVADLVVAAVSLPNRAQLTTLTVWPTRLA